MQKLFRCVLFSVAVAALAPLAHAGDLKLTLGSGRVTLIAQDVPLRQILAEWARIGKTTIVNGDKLIGPPLTLQLVDRPEREVLELLLNSASGYIAAQRETMLAGASVFDRVMILPTSRGPVGAASAPAPAQFPRPGMNSPMPIVDEDDPVGAQVLPPGMGGPPIGGPNPPVNPGNPPAQPTLTSPRPGMLPAPPAGQPNPYGTTPLPPGARPPGVGPGGFPGQGPGGPGGPGKDL